MKKLFIYFSLLLVLTSHVKGQVRADQLDSITSFTPDMYIWIYDPNSSPQSHRFTIHRLDQRYQMGDDNLSAISGVSANGFLTRTGAQSAASRILTGTANRLSVTNSDGVSGNPIFDIATTYAGQLSINTLGTVTTGTWNAAPVTVSYGGTGNTTLTSYAPLFGGTTGTGAIQSGTVGTTGQVLTSNGAGALPTFQDAGGSVGSVNNINISDGSGGFSSSVLNVITNDLLPNVNNQSDLGSVSLNFNEGWINNLYLQNINDLTYPSSDGTNGQVLTTDGAGTVSFQDAEGGNPYVVVNSTGTLPNVTGTDAIGIGEVSTAGGGSAVAIGPAAFADGTSAVAIGSSAGSNSGGADGSNSISIGNGSNGDPGIAIGMDAIGIGTTPQASGIGSIAIGRNIQTTAQGAIMMGWHTADQTNSISDSFELSWDGTTGFKTGLTVGTTITNNIDPDTNLGDATEGTLAWDTDADEFRFYDGTSWASLSPGGGGGDVTKVGTPANNQIGVWTGDGTIEGDPNFIFDGTDFLLSRSGTNRQDIILDGGTDSGGEPIGTINIKVASGTVSNRPLFGFYNNGVFQTLIRANGDWDYNSNRLEDISELEVGLLQYKVPVELTISTGAITITQSFHSVDTESDASTDDLDTVSGGTTGDEIIIRASVSSRTVVLKDGTGNLRLAGDFSLDNSDDVIKLIFDGVNWLEVSRSDNGA